MTPFVALLRAVNVSGRNKIGMAELCKSCEALGFTEVRSYLQSGNLVFRGDGSPGDISAALEARIVQDFGHAVEVLVMPGEEMAHVVSTNPLRPQTGKLGRLYHATFLFRHVSETRFAELELPAQEGEKAVLVGRVVLLCCPQGYGKTRLNNVYFENALGVPATTRNWRTVLKLRDLSAAK
jgi:uncharacterized protein (DUF1697 family)